MTASAWQLVAAKTLRVSMRLRPGVDALCGSVGSCNAASAAQQSMQDEVCTPATHCVASSLCRLFVRLQHSTQPQLLGPSDGRAWTWSVCAVEQWRGEPSRP